MENLVRAKGGPLAPSLREREKRLMMEGCAGGVNRAESQGPSTESLFGSWRIVTKLL
jgi:hypothetical protein